MSDADLSSPRPLREALGSRLLATIVLAVLLSLSQTVLTALAVLQFALLLASRGEPNPQIAASGAALGRWCAQAAGYLAAATEEKPWPWRPLD